jgi:hypothetical protein
VKREYIGKRGERIFEVLIMDFCGGPQPLFDPIFFGDKFRTLDYYVELVGAQTRRYFFIQVKSTRQGYSVSKGKRRLRVNVTQEDVDRMVAFPAPTYVVGIDEQTRQGYLLAVNEARRGIAGLPTTYPLTCASMHRLWHEVNEFWSNRDMVLKNSYFSE